MSQPPRIAVLGSLNIDHYLKVGRIPERGETIIAHSSEKSFGGKGANQAIAASRAGASVSLIACVGSDPDGVAYIEYLTNEGIDASSLVPIQETDTATGSALITVDSEGENTIIVNPGANYALSIEIVNKREALIADAAALLLQWECPAESVKRAAEIARTNSVDIVINPSPWNDAFLEARIPCDYLIVNETEAAWLTGVSPFHSSRMTPELVRSLGVKAIIVTQGPRQTLALSPEGPLLEIKPPSANVVDTVGAGDSFAGALTVALAEGMPLEKAIRFANTSGSLATQQLGAQSSIPTRAQIEEAMSQLG